MLYAFFSVTVVILTIILFAPYKTEIDYKEKTASVATYVAGIRVSKREFGTKNKKSGDDSSPMDKMEESKNEVSVWGEKIKEFKAKFNVASSLLKKYVEIENVELEIDIGTQDAALTAVATGILWGAVYEFLGILGSIMYIKKHNVQINPIYTNSAFYVDGKCILRSRLVYIIIIIIAILTKKQSRKGKEE